MRLKLELKSYLSSTSAGEKDLGNVERGPETTDAMNEGSTRKYRVADGTTNQAIDLGGLAEAKFLLVQTDREVTIRSNGVNEVVVAPPDDFDFGYMLVTTSDITSLDVSNSSGGTAAVIVQLAGDID